MKLVVDESGPALFRPELTNRELRRVCSPQRHRVLEAVTSSGSAEGKKNPKPMFLCLRVLLTRSSNSLAAYTQTRGRFRTLAWMQSMCGWGWPGDGGLSALEFRDITGRDGSGSAGWRWPGVPMGAGMTPPCGRGGFSLVRVHVARPAKSGPRGCGRTACAQGQVAGIFGAVSAGGRPGAPASRRRAGPGHLTSGAPRGPRAPSRATSRSQDSKAAVIEEVRRSQAGIIAKSC